MNFQDKQGHDDGEYAIAQRFDPVFADFEILASPFIRAPVGTL